MAIDRDFEERMRNRGGRPRGPLRIPLSVLIDPGTHESLVELCRVYRVSSQGKMVDKLVQRAMRQLEKKKAESLTYCNN